MAFLLCLPQSSLSIVSLSPFMLPRWKSPLSLRFLRQPVLFYCCCCCGCYSLHLRVTRAGRNFFHAPALQMTKMQTLTRAYVDSIVCALNVHAVECQYVRSFCLQLQIAWKKGIPAKFRKLKQVKLHTLYAITHSLTHCHTHTHQYRIWTTFPRKYDIKI